MRRGVGIGGIAKHKATNEQFLAKASELEQLKLDQITEQMSKFKTNLETFATTHRNKIKKNPEFRKQFQVMCGTIGVDPLASQKGFWSELLGVGDFYYELGVQAVEVCLVTRPSNGGLIGLSELTDRLRRKRGASSNPISEDDVSRAIKKLAVFGGGFDVVDVGSKRIVRSVPGELNRDHNTVFIFAADLGYATASQLVRAFQWSEERAQSVLNQLVADGVAWVDNQSDETQYWLPCLSTNTAL